MIGKRISRRAAEAQRKAQRSKFIHQGTNTRRTRLKGRTCGHDLRATPDRCRERGTPGGSARQPFTSGHVPASHPPQEQ
jgi:hypothetical protein